MCFGGRLSVYWGFHETLHPEELEPEDGLRVGRELFSLYCSKAAICPLGHLLNCALFVALTLDLGPMRGEGELMLMRTVQFGKKGPGEDAPWVFTRTAWKTRRSDRVRFVGWVLNRNLD